MRFGSVLCALLLMAFAVPGTSKDEGFSGTWVLDKGSPLPPDAPNNLRSKIKQNDSGVTIESTFKEPENGIVPLLYLGVMTTRVHLGLNGDPQQNTIGPFQMASKTTLSGNQMQTDWTAMVNGEPVQGHWTHTLSDDGKHMTLEIHETSAQGQSGDATLHFVKK